MSYKICFVCTGNACRSPFAECVMKKRLSDAGMDNIEVFSVGTLDWGENPRDVVITDVAKEMGYELTGITTRMTHDRLMEADVIIVFDQQHHDAITSVLNSAWLNVSPCARAAGRQDPGDWCRRVGLVHPTLHWRA